MSCLGLPNTNQLSPPGRLQDPRCLVLRTLRSERPGDRCGQLITRDPCAKDLISRPTSSRPIRPIALVNGLHVVRCERVAHRLHQRPGGGIGHGDVPLPRCRRGCRRLIGTIARVDERHCMCSGSRTTDRFAPPGRVSARFRDSRCIDDALNRAIVLRLRGLRTLRPVVVHTPRAARRRRVGFFSGIQCLNRIKWPPTPCGRRISGRWLPQSCGIPYRILRYLLPQCCGFWMPQACGISWCCRHFGLLIRPDP